MFLRAFGATLQLVHQFIAVQVAKVTAVDEIDSVKLYKCTVDVGGGVTKHVVAGLKQHIAKADLLESIVIVITNLKPAKLAGELSEVMILAAQAVKQDTPQGEIVKILQPPGRHFVCVGNCLDKSWCTHSRHLCL